jgi:hypothetical protein
VMLLLGAAQGKEGASTNGNAKVCCTYSDCSAVRAAAHIHTHDTHCTQHATQKRPFHCSSCSHNTERFTGAAACTGDLLH